MKDTYTATKKYILIPYCQTWGGKASYGRMTKEGKNRRWECGVVAFSGMKIGPPKNYTEHSPPTNIGGSWKGFYQLGVSWENQQLLC